MNKLRKMELSELPSDIVKKVSKDERNSFFKKCFFRTFLFLSLYACHVAGKDVKIHLKSNIENSYSIMKYFSFDSNGDGINEIGTETLEYVGYFFDPTDDSYYKNSNVFYNLSDETTISNNVSFLLAARYLDCDLIEIDGVKYSTTGYITEIDFTEYFGEERHCTISTSETFQSRYEIRQYLSQLFDPQGKGYYYIINSYDSYEAETFENIPTIIKSKDDGTVTLKDPNIITTNTVKVLVRKIDN